jgi:hypothetical protein
VTGRETLLTSWQADAGYRDTRWGEVLPAAEELSAAASEWEAE